MVNLKSDLKIKSEGTLKLGKPLVLLFREKITIRLSIENSIPIGPFGGTGTIIII